MNRETESLMDKNAYREKILKDIHSQGSILPYQILEVTPEASMESLKSQFSKFIEQKDVGDVSLAYEIVTTFKKTKKLPPYCNFEDEVSFKVKYTRNNPIVLTLLNFAAALEYVFENDANAVNCKTSNKSSLLYLAARSGYLGLIKILLRYGFNISGMENGSTPLHAASFYGHPAVVRFLLENGASPIKKNKFKDTPLKKLKPKKSENYSGTHLKINLLNLSSQSIKILYMQELSM